MNYVRIFNVHGGIKDIFDDVKMHAVPRVGEFIRYEYPNRTYQNLEVRQVFHRVRDGHDQDDFGTTVFVGVYVPGVPISD